MRNEFTLLVVLMFLLGERQEIDKKANTKLGW